MNEEKDYLEFTCKLSPESGDRLFVSAGGTVLFDITNGENSIGVGLDEEDIKELIQYLIRFL
jgi:hypothetical protein